MRRHMAVATLAAALVTGCGSDATGVSVNLAGEWLGGTTTQAVAITIRFTLQDGSGLQGSGTISGNGVANCPPGVTGSRSGTSVTLTFTCQGFAPLGFSGSVNSDATRISGTLSGSGFAPIGITFVRQ